MNLRKLAWHWTEFGKRDPLWAILTEKNARHGRWDEAAFFATGEAEIARLSKDLDALGLPPRRLRALDFGCGVGRLTQALCRYFEECEGVDIAPSMISLAERYNRFGPRCRYHLNESSDLRRFEDHRFDLVYSNIVLQHMRPDLARGYVEEFVRVVATDGLVVFQMRDEHRPLSDLSRWWSSWARERGSSLARMATFQPRMQMHGVRPDVVLGWVSRAGATLVDLRVADPAGARPGFFYYIARSARCTAVDSQRILASAAASILPGGAFRAAIHVADPPSGVDHDAEMGLSVRVKNLSPVTWPGSARAGRYEIRLGNHWLDHDGRLLIQDDGRAALFEDLQPGQDTTLSLRVKAPSTSGHYLLELDMVQECVGWFGAFGSGTVRIPVSVR
jgi:SAM-dependent methyltransferase